MPMNLNLFLIGICSLLWGWNLSSTMTLSSWRFKCVNKNKKQGSFQGGGSANCDIILQGTFDGCSCNRPEPGSHPVIPDQEFQCQLNNRCSSSGMQNILCTSLTDPSLEHSDSQDASCTLASLVLALTHLRGFV